MSGREFDAPWAVNPFVAQVDCSRIVDDEPVPVCQLLWPTDLRSEAETARFASLISAAPELLGGAYEAVQSLAWIEAQAESIMNTTFGCAGTSGDPEGGFEIANRAASDIAINAGIIADRLRAVIAKATGIDDRIVL